MFIDRDFFNTVPIEKKEYVNDKIRLFKKHLKEYKSFKNMPQGYYIRNIKGTNIYKFRVSKGERILYRYNRSHNAEDIIILNYCNHDEQIRKGRSYSYTKLNEDDILEYNEEDFDKEIDELVRNEYLDKYKYHDFVSDDILDEDTITLAVESNIADDKKYLTFEQFSCINKVDMPTIILGCAGSGKTLIGVKKLSLNKSLKLKTAYITESKRLKKITQDLYNDIERDDLNLISFHTLEEICLDILNIDSQDVMDYKKFNEWIRGTKFNKKITKSLSVRKIWNEINCIIKGTASYDKGIINEDEYMKNSNSKADSIEKKIIYSVASAYNKWVWSSAFWDKNDIYNKILKSMDKPLFDAVVYDEIQELTSKEIQVLKKINKNSSNSIYLGDYSQRINQCYDNINEIEKIIDGEFRICILDKNFRSVLGTVEWINKLKDIQRRSNKDNDKYKINIEIAMRQGEKPDYYKIEKDIGTLFNNISNDVQSIIIVPDEETRNYMSNNNIDVSRVFLVEDSVGIEYDKVYCFNLMKYAEEFNDYNKVYIAATRSRYRVIFIEENEAELIKEFENYYNSLDEKELFEDIVIEQDTVKWIKEAENLEYLEKYYQAAKAYEKAGEHDRKVYCEKMHEKQTTLFNLVEKGIYIDMYIDDFTEEFTNNNLEIILNKLEAEYKLKLNSWIEITTYHSVGNLPKNSYVYLEHDIDNKTMSQNILKLINKRIMSNNHITLKILETDIINSDIEVKMNEGNIKIEKNNMLLLRTIENQKKIEKKIIMKDYNIPYGINMKKIEFQKRIANKSTEEILNDIFS